MVIRKAGREARSRARGGIMNDICDTIHLSKSWNEEKGEEEEEEAEVKMNR